MATLTDTIKARLLRRLNDTGQAYFTNDILADLYDEADSDFNKTLYLGFLELVTNHSALANYSMGQSSESRAQIWEHLNEMLKRYEALAGVQAGTLSTGTMKLNLDQDESEEWS